MNQNSIRLPQEILDLPQQQPEPVNPTKEMLRTQTEKHQPKLYNELLESGELEEFLNREAEAWEEELDLLMKEGMTRPAALEIVWQDQLLPDEDDTEKPVDWSQVDPVLYFDHLRDLQEKANRDK